MAFTMTSIAQGETIVSKINRLLKDFADRRQDKRDLITLMHMSDRHLIDMGIDRNEIRSELMLNGYWPDVR